MRMLNPSVSTPRRAISRTAVAGAAAICLSAPGLAASAGPGGPAGPNGPDGQGGESSSWGLGVAAISVQKPYTGIDRETTALPVLFYENRWVRVLGPVAEFKLHRLDIGDSQQIDFRLVARYDGSGYEAGDAPILHGMAERKGGFWAGAKATWRSDIANLSAEWTADASGNSKGQRFSVSLEKNWRLGERVMLAPRLGATWYDKKYVDYYFGVLSSEAAVGRAAYAGKSGVNAEVGLRSTYLFDQKHSVFLDLGLTSLAKGIKDSPLVGKSTENRVFAGYLYRF